MNYKLCPKCKLNYIKENQQMCDVCISKNTNGVSYGRSKYGPICEYFTFTNEMRRYKSGVAYEAYNSDQKNVGYVFMSDDDRTPAYGHCEIHFYPAYHNKYQEWRRITSHGRRIPWKELLQKLKREGSCKYYID